MRKLVFLFMLILAACTDETTATRILANEGYEQIHFTGYDWFSCGQGDFYATGFIASKNGKTVKGTVCSGLLFKSSTIRYE